MISDQLTRVTANVSCFIYLCIYSLYCRASLVAQVVKNLPAMPETWVRYLGWEHPLQKRTVTHSSILAWRIPWTEETGRLQSGAAKSQTRPSDFRLHIVDAQCCV